MLDANDHSLYAKAAVGAIGAAVLLTAFIYLPQGTLSAGFLMTLAFAAGIAPHLTLKMPRSRFAISFSDAVIFLTFLLFGGWAAIIVAAVESAANCFYLRRRGYQIDLTLVVSNVAINTISIALTFLAWLNLPKLPFAILDADTTQHTIATLGALAILQFVFSSILVAGISAIQTGTSFYVIWTRDVFASWLTQIVGAAVAGVVYSVIQFGDLLTALIAFGALTIAYFTYRQSIQEINDAMDEAEEAQRLKAETERAGRKAAEEHAQQLKITLENEEKANAALRKSERDFQHAALHDSLTRLPNRKHLGDILRGAIADYKNNPSATFHVLFLDISRFKNINDSLGHTIGDKVLMIAARRFVRMLNSGDTVARIGGDEFAVVLKGLQSTGNAQKIARRIFNSIAQPFSVGGNSISLSINIGVAPCDEEYSTPEDVLRDADIAMHYAKEKDTGVAVFTKELRHRFLERITFENDLRSAIDREELSMNYQPLINLHDGGLLGFEALLRWNHSDLGNIPPNKFIPVAEDSGLIVPITEWILRQTCSQIVNWQKISAEYRDIIVSVNISGKHLMSGDLVSDVEHALEMSKLAPSALKLEITESVAMENAEHTINVLNRLKALGVKLSLDDFGTGYSSLSILQRLPFDTLKIDRSFVSSVGPNGENSEILQTIISLAKNLKMRVIAEGIETHAQLNLLRNLGCDFGQGYLLAKPKARDVAEQMLYETANWLPAELDSTPAAKDTSADDSLPVF